VEADWSVEIGADLPIVAVPWEGFVDLRREPLLAQSLAETTTAPALAQMLVKLNAAAAPVFTSKCDLWTLAADDIDPLEFEASREDAQVGTACYIDVIARDPTIFASFTLHEAWVRAATAELREMVLSQARVELVVREALVDDLEGFAVTLYTAACSSKEAGVQSTFRDALEAAAAITIKRAAAAGE
jgi:hypothetical protein